MTHEIMEWLNKCSNEIEPKRVLEIGSYNVNGTPRTHFQSKASEYIGVDKTSGPGVDIVTSAHSLPFKDGFNTIICCEMLEHDDKPLETIAEMKRLLLPGGYLIVTSPANCFPLHRYPRDYWRLMPDTYEDIIFSGMTIVSRHVTSDPCNCYMGHST